MRKNMPPLQNAKVTNPSSPTRAFFTACTVILILTAPAFAAYYNLGSYWQHNANHAGWNNIVAVGAKTPAPASSGLASAALYVTLGWNAMTFNYGTIASYNIYRATTSGGQNFAAPLATGISATTRSYTDTTGIAGTTYYYVVRPVSGTAVLATPQPYSEVKVAVPPANMALVHRWMANQEICGLMARTTDPNNNFRCTYTGPGNVGGYYDQQKSFFMDMFEMGCNWTPTPSCTSGVGCLFNGTPSNIKGVNGNIGYARTAGACNNKISGTWSNIGTGGLTAAQLYAMSSNAPGLPPLMDVNQADANTICNQYTVSGFAGTKRLPSHREFIAAAAWLPNLTDAQIGTIENGVNINTTFNCNTNGASGLTFDNNITPADLETIPYTLNSTFKAVRTGSNSTANCVSRYGIQDLIGNINEWQTDQLATCSATTHVCTGQTSALDTANTDLNGFKFDGVIGPGGATITQFDLSTAPNSATKFIVPVGLPVVTGSAASWDGITIGTSAGQFDPAKFHNDFFDIYTDSPTGTPARGMYAGGNWLSGSAAGRFNADVANPPANVFASAGFRCVIPSE